MPRGNLKPHYKVCPWPVKAEETLFPRSRVSAWPLCPRPPPRSTVTCSDRDLQRRDEKLFFLRVNFQKGS